MGVLADIQQFFSLGSTGVLGINARNLDYVISANPRKYYKNVDDKARTKMLALDAGVPTPELFTIIEYQEQLKRLNTILAPYKEFVIKPAQGSGGGGIMVISGRKGDNYIKASGLRISAPELSYHISNILGGLFTLGGASDKAIIERRVCNPDLLDKLSFQGVPDIRLIIYRGVPVMAMLRLPTRKSDGKANLHAGGVGVGVDITCGTTTHAIADNQNITIHPDTDEDLIGITLPFWDNILDMGVKSAVMTQLGYIGVDIVIDKDHGPQLLEVNARPGIAIQTANQTGLVERFKHIDDQPTFTNHNDAITFAKKHFA